MSHAENETVQVKCSYPKSETNSEKSLCKGKSPSDCDEVISSTEEDRTVKNGKFDLRDNRRLNYFYVYINNLHKSDAGTYWCGYGGTKNIKIQLSVAEARTKVGPLPTQSEQLTTLPKARKTEISRDTVGSDYDEGQGHNPELRGSPGIIAGIVCAVLIVVVIVVVVLSRQKLFNRQACCASGGGSEQKTNKINDGEHQYEAIPMQNKEESADQTLYSTVNQPADQLNYASIKILNSGSAVADEDKNGSSTSKNNPKGAAHPPIVTTIYSTIGKLGE
ncbi:CMRF35-like molecule 5 [Fundulus heteroclitus]|uniref:CMRF35-like molecule 5 n=1 Tax=Fundulus heteroclitus TaxID=8078 RepID=UPI00165C21A8|nr:CMRF35-like molecule 5 [Fundulus heteroclitus]